MRSPEFHKLLKSQVEKLANKVLAEHGAIINVDEKLAVLKPVSSGNRYGYSDGMVLRRHNMKRSNELESAILNNGFENNEKRQRSDPYTAGSSKGQA